MVFFGLHTFIDNFHEGRTWLGKIFVRGIFIPNRTIKRAEPTPEATQETVIADDAMRIGTWAISNLDNHLTQVESFAKMII